MYGRKAKNRASFFKVKENTPDFMQTPEFGECARKKKFESKRIAQKSADETMNEYGGFLRVYKCNFCKKYHLTSKEKY